MLKGLVDSAPKTNSKMMVDDENTDTEDDVTRSPQEITKIKDTKRREEEEEEEEERKESNIPPIIQMKEAMNQGQNPEHILHKQSM